MSSSVRKPLIGLVVLLACPLAGVGGRAEASFRLERTDDRMVRVLADGAVSVRVETTCDTGATATSAVPLRPTPEPQPSPWKGPTGPAHATQHSGGTTSSSGSPSGDLASGGAVFVLLPRASLAGEKALRGALFLAEQRFQPGPFPTRLYRPPRGHG